MKHGSMLFRLILIMLPAMLFSPLSLRGEEILSEEFGWAQNLTETWELLDYDANNGIASFSDMEGHAIYQILLRDPDQGGEDAAVLGAQIASQLAGTENPEADTAPFSFSGHSAALTEAKWTAGSNPVHGYIVTIDDTPLKPGASPYPFDYILIAFSLEEEFNLYHDFILSNLDGFSPLETETPMPGAVSQFIRSSGGSPPGAAPLEPVRNPEPGMSSQRLQPMLNLPLKPGSQADIEAAVAVIDREARILNQFAEAPEETRTAAWRRFYQMLYKDSWYDMRSAAEVIAGRLEGHGVMRSEWPGEILSWVQNFAYRRTGSLSDLEPAWVCINEESGDCDSLGLAYMAILEHLGFDTALMISEKHSHSLVGVDVNGPGARFPFDGTQWLVAELTADVSIGMIAADQSNPEDWMGFDLGFRAE